MFEVRNSNGLQRTAMPMTTGSSVIGVKYDTGIVIACDTKGSYGTLSRYDNLNRVTCVNNNTILAASGDYADYQYLMNILDSDSRFDAILNDGFESSPKAVHTWLGRVLYNRRSRINPLWNTYVVGGIENGEPYLGYADKIGTCFTSNTIATGMGGYLAQPLLREGYKSDNFSKSEAIDLVKKGMTMLFYRDKSASDNIQIAVVSKNEDVEIKRVKLESNWDMHVEVRGYE